MAEFDLSGPEWGFWLNADFVILPKLPMLRAGLGPPPFQVVMPDGALRHIVERPAQMELELEPDARY